MTSNKTMSKMHQRVDNKVKGIEPVNPETVNNFWDLAKEHYFSAIKAIELVEGQLAEVLRDFINDKEKIKLVKDPVLLTSNINLLAKDILQHTDTLNKIYEKHKNKSGGTSTPDDHMEVLQIHGEYSDVMEVYSANVVPTVNFIIEQIGLSEELLKAQRLSSQQNLQDPNVISDIEIKETKND